MGEQPRASVLRLLGRLGLRTYGGDPEAFDAGIVEKTLAALERLGALQWLPVEVTGLEHVPAAPALVIMNHSGGTSIPDVWGLLYAWYRHFGVGRPLHPLAHEFVVGTPITGRFMERRGVLLASWKIARKAIMGHRHDVLVLPGGDREAWRPYADRWRVDFGERRGYAKLALQAGVAVVPVAHAGAHETLRVLWRGERLARALGLPRLARAEIFPVHLSLPWGLGVGPLPHIPWPSRLRYRVLPPVGGGPPIAEPTRAQIVELDEKVRAAIQEGLEGLRREG